MIGAWTLRSMRIARNLHVREKRAFWGTIQHIINPDLDVSKRTLWRHGSGGEVDAAVDKWQSFDDKALGGASHLEMENVEEDGGHLVIKGSLDLDEETAEEMQVRGGYCAVKGSCSSVVDLRDYEGLKMMLRSPHKELTFTMNMSTASLFDDDIYQVKCEIQPSTEWKSIEVPFSAFVLTSHGRIKEYQRANDSLQVESIGFLFKTEDGTESPFQLELKDITAMPSF